MIPLIFPKVPRSSLGILRIPELPPPLEHPPPLKNPATDKVRVVWFADKLTKSSFSQRLKDNSWSVALLGQRFTSEQPWKNLWYDVVDDDDDDVDDDDDYDYDENDDDDKDDDDDDVMTMTAMTTTTKMMMTTT